VPYASPSTDYDDGDRTKQANGARCALDYFGAPFLAEKFPLSANEKRFLEFTGTLDPQQGLPFSRWCTVVEIIHIVSQQSNAFKKPSIADIKIMLHAMSNMHEPSVVQGSDEADNHLVKMIRGKLIAEQLPHSSDRPFGNRRQTTNGIGCVNSWVPSTNKHVVKTAEEMQTDYPVRREETFRHGYIPYKDDEKARLAFSCMVDSLISLALLPEKKTQYRLLWIYIPRTRGKAMIKRRP